MENKEKKEIIKEYISINEQIDSEVRDFVIDFVYDIAINEKDKRMVEKIERIARTPITFEVLTNGSSGQCKWKLIYKNGKIDFVTKIELSHLKAIIDENSIKETVAHEIGHLFVTDWESINDDSIIFKTGVHIKEINLRNMLINERYEGLEEAINSLRTTDRLTRMGIDFKTKGYSIAQDLLSAIRETYSIDDAIIKAEESHDVRKISQAIKEHELFVHSQISEKAILDEIDKAFETIYKNYISDMPADEAVASSLAVSFKLITFLNISVTLPATAEDYVRELIRFRYIDKGIEIEQGKVKELEDDLIR